jgi:hypothetical protein
MAGGHTSAFASLPWPPLFDPVQEFLGGVACLLLTGTVLAGCGWLGCGPLRLTDLIALGYTLATAVLDGVST